MSRLDNFLDGWERKIQGFFKVAPTQEAPPDATPGPPTPELNLRVFVDTSDTVEVVESEDG